MYNYRCDDGYQFNSNDPGLTNYIHVAYVGRFYFNTESMANKAKKVEEDKGYTVTIGRVSCMTL